MLSDRWTSSTYLMSRRLPNQTTASRTRVSGELNPRLTNSSASASCGPETRASVSSVSTVPIGLRNNAHEFDVQLGDLSDHDSEEEQDQLLDGVSSEGEAGIENRRGDDPPASTAADALQNEPLSMCGRHKHIRKTYQCSYTVSRPFRSFSKRPDPSVKPSKILNPGLA